MDGWMNIIQIIPLPFYMLYPDGYQSRAGTVSKRWSWLTARGYTVSLSYFELYAELDHEAEWAAG